MSCELSKSQMDKLYDKTSHQWTLSDSDIDELDKNIQAVINCSAEDDLILFNTKTTVRPKTSLLIPWSLTFDSKSVGEDKSQTKVQFSCPESGDLFTIR